jgi:hypothetical protein
MAFAQTVSDSHTLDYAKAPPWRRRKSVRRAIAAGVLALILLAALKFARPAWDHVRLLHHQDRCLKHVLPPDRVVLDDTRQWQPNSVSPDWERFYSIFSPPGRSLHQATIFLHEMQRPGGASRLVVVEVSAATQIIGTPPEVGCDVVVIRPAGLWSRPKLLHDYFCMPRSATHHALSTQRTFRMFAGQPDPANSAHFTIDYQSDGKNGTIDGWLQSDDTILLESRAPVSH